jgi:glycosyltransferase involved in cell wall biosynthesis
MQLHPVRILSVFNHYVEHGGEAIAVEAIYSALSQVYEVEKCEFRSEDWLGSEAPPKWKQALWMMRNPQSVKKLRDAHAHFHPDFWLVHNVFPVASGAVYSEARRLGVPLIQYVHNFRPFSVNGYLWAGDRLAAGGLSKNYWQEIYAGAWQHSRAKTAWLAAILLWGHTAGWWRGVRTWIAISEFMRQKFISAGVPAADIFTLRHYWKPKETRSSSEGTHFLFLGRLTEAKGITVLLDAWELLERRCGASTPKLLIGGDGPLRALVIEKAERMKSVTFAGTLSGAAKKQAFDQARAVIVPSISWEALGLIVYEAYDHYRPVLVARSGGLPEVVVDSETGLIHDPGNTEQLIEHVLKLQNDNQSAEEMGCRGRLWLEAHANESEWRKGFAVIAEHARKPGSVP